MRKEKFDRRFLGMVLFSFSFEDSWILSKWKAKCAEFELREQSKVGRTPKSVRFGMLARTTGIMWSANVIIENWSEVSETDVWDRGKLNSRRSRADRAEREVGH